MYYTMKRKSQKQLKDDCFQAYQKIKGTKMPPKTYRTKPFLDIDKTKSEAEVLKECLAWFKRKNIFVDRMNVGSGVLGAGGYRAYGIAGAGDIVGLLQNGRHLEVEVKRGKGGVLSIKQLKREADITKNNGIYLIVHSVAELEYYLKEVI